MRNTKFVVAALMLSAVSFASSAATEVKQPKGEKMGIVSVTGADTLDGLTEQLSKKADKAGATYFRIVSAAGQNTLHGSAEIYK
ncbi:MAG: DUF1471 domain-containing protein [Enterobacteriaceae bacterium]|jgi:ABC-type phosphate transport system substrate-binding protein|nr:DUF1471 domain-containing protein [Enterobacteriaceae bacterium]